MKHSLPPFAIMKALPEHIPYLAAHMREADVCEVWASHRHTPEGALRVSLENSELAWTCLIETAGVSSHIRKAKPLDDGAGLFGPAPENKASLTLYEEKTPLFQPIMMFGASRNNSTVNTTGVPWLLATPEVFTVQFRLLKICRGYVAKMQERFPVLENYVHADNAASIRWLRWCGFTIDNVPETINGKDFYLFWRQEKCMNR